MSSSEARSSYLHPCLDCLLSWTVVLVRTYTPKWVSAELRRYALLRRMQGPAMTRTTQAGSNERERERATWVSVSFHCSYLWSLPHRGARLRNTGTAPFSILTRKESKSRYENLPEHLHSTAQGSHRDQIQKGRNRRKRVKKRREKTSHR